MAFTALFHTATPKETGSVGGSKLIITEWFGSEATFKEGLGHH